MFACMGINLVSRGLRRKREKSLLFNFVTEMFSILVTYLEKSGDHVRKRRPAVLTEDFRSFF